MKYTPEAETFYNSMNTFTEAIENGTTDLERLVSFCMDYKEALKTETIEEIESIAEAYLTDIVPSILVALDKVKHDLKGEFKDIPKEDEAVDISET